MQKNQNICDLAFVDHGGAQAWAWKCYVLLRWMWLFYFLQAHLDSHMKIHERNSIHYKHCDYILQTFLCLFLSTCANILLKIFRILNVSIRTPWKEFDSANFLISGIKANNICQSTRADTPVPCGNVTNVRAKTSSYQLKNIRVC